MDTDAVLTAFNTQLRQAGHEWDGPVARAVADDPNDWSGVVWSDLDESNADAVIARQVQFFTGRDWEWKYYSYDQPADLPQRLTAAGLVPEDDEALMIAEVSELPHSDPPDGIRLELANTEAGIAALVEVHEKVFGDDHSRLRGALLARLAQAPETFDVVLAMAGDQPVCTARIEYRDGTDFAGLWGGGTLPEWRGRGVYRSLVSYRARLAAARGVRYLQVDASDDSRPILARLGFAQLATTVPYKPAAFAAK